MKRRSVILALLLGSTLSAPAWARDVALVSYKANPLSDLALADLTKACKGETSRWPDGKPVTVVMKKPSLMEMKLVLEKIYGADEKDVTRTIAAANHARTNHPAVVLVETDQEVLYQVSNTPGAVGLVDVYSINSSVAVLKVGGRLPLEPGYALHGN